MQKQWLYRGFIIFFFVLPIAFLPAVVSAESQWLKRGTRHGGLLGGVIGQAANVGNAVKETATELTGYLKDSFDAFDAGDMDTIERIDKKLEKLPGKLALKAIPGSGLVEGALEVSDTVKDKLAKGWQSAKEKIDRFYSGDSETNLDPRTALSVDEDRREWHASEGGILDDAPLQEVTLTGYEELPFAEQPAAEVTPDDGENPWSGDPGNVDNDDWNISEEAIEDADPWGNEYDDTADPSQYAEASEPPADSDDEWQVVEEVTEEDGPWEELV